MNVNAPTKSAQKENEEISAAEALTSLCGKLSSAPPSPDLAPALTVQILPMPALPALQTAPASHETWQPQQQAKPKTKADKVKKNFPQKLFGILEDPEHANILKWLPGGKAFIIMDKRRFAEDILPSFFKQTQFTSFTRKLSRWKFVRVPRGPFMGAYYHKLFRRDHIALCKLMSCNNDAPSLAVIAQARQQAMASISTSPRPNVMGLSLPQQNALKSLEEINRVSMIKQQLLSIRLKRAQLYEQQKRIIRHAESSRTVHDSQNRLQQHDSQNRLQQHPNQLPYLHQTQMSRPECYTNDSRSSSRIIEDASRALRNGNAMEYNVQMSQLAKLRQTGMLDRAAAARAHYMRTMQQSQIPQGQSGGQDQPSQNSRNYRASAA